jgi:hypothetical protein
MISIFAKPAKYFKRTKYYDYPHLQRASSIIRGEQVASYLGARLNPTDENDEIKIYVKPERLDNLKDGSFVDIVDSVRLARDILKYPKLNAIVLSDLAKWYLNSMGKDSVFVIPQHHCNIERTERDRDSIDTVGFIGSTDSFDYPLDTFGDMLKDIGMDFLYSLHWGTREEVVSFYKNIDIQVSWNTTKSRHKALRDSLRLKNAASFGIPTVSYPEVNHRDFSGYYIEVTSIEDMVKGIEKLKNREYYTSWSEKVKKKAEEFHISNIVELYKKLCV